MIKKSDKIFVAGHNGLVGSAVVRLLKKKNYRHIILKNKRNLDLFDQRKVEKFLRKNKPKVVLYVSKVKAPIVIVENNPAKIDFLISFFFIFL